MTEKTILMGFIFFAWILCYYFYWDCNRMMKKVRTELEEIGLDFEKE